MGKRNTAIRESIDMLDDILEFIEHSREVYDSVVHAMDVMELHTALSQDLEDIQAQIEDVFVKLHKAELQDYE